MLNSANLRGLTPLFFQSLLFILKQRSKHDHRILIRSIVLPHRTGDHTKFFEAKFFPETARDKIFRKL